MVTAAERKQARQRQMSEEITKWREGEISKEEASRRVKTIYRGGGRGRAADSERFTAAKIAEAKAKADASRIAETKRIAAEIKRIAEAKRQAEIRATQTQQALREKTLESQRQLEPTRETFEEEQQRRIYTKEVDRTGQIYDSRTGMYVKAPYGVGAGGTAIMTPPTEKERIKIKTVQEKGDLYGKAIVKIPSQYLGTVFDKQISEKTYKKFEGKGFVERGITLLNPKTQWEIYKESEEKKKAIRESNKIMNQIEKLNKRYNEGKMSYESYSAKYEYLSTQPEVSKAQVPTMSFKQAVGKSSLTETQKGYIGVGIAATQILPYFSPAGRVLLGSGQVVEGVETLKYAETKEEKTMGKIQIGVGGIIAVSGLKGISLPKTKPTFLGTKLTGTTSQMNWLMGAKQAGIITFGSSLGTLEGVSTYKETGSMGMAIGAGVGTTAILTSPVWIKPIVSQFKKDVKGVKEWAIEEKKYGLLKRKPSTGGISKRGSTQLMARQESKYIYDYKTGKYILKSKVGQPTPLQIETKFKSLSSKEQTKVITRALEKTVFLDTKSKGKFILQWTRFMKKSGLSNQQIQTVLLKSGLIQKLPVQKTSTILITKTKVAVSQGMFQPSKVGETKWAVSQGVFQDSLQSQRQIQKLGQDIKQEQTQKQIQWLGQETKQKTKQRQIQLLGLATKQAQITEQQPKQEQLLSMKIPSEQIPKQIQRPKLETINIFEEGTKPKPPEEPLPVIPSLSLTKRMLKRVKEEPSIFEAFAFKFGKEKSLGKGTKLLTTSKLSKYLKKELSASGFITKGGKKILAIETGLLKKPSFRKSKVSEFLVVERKTRRLRKGGTGKTIQFFRKKSKGKKSKNLFGF